MLLGGISLLSLIGIYRDDKYRDAVLFLFSCVVLPFVLVFVVSHIVQPIWIPRAMLLSLPAFYILIAIGSQRIEMKKAYLSLMFIPLLWMSLSSLSYLRNEHRLPYEQIARYLESESESGMPLLVDGTYLMNPLYFYYKGQGSLYELWETNVSVVPVSHKENLSRILLRIRESENRLILVTFREPPSELSSSSAYRAVRRKDYNVLGEDMGQLKNMSIFFYEKNQNRS
jgi:hypothetical protein